MTYLITILSVFIKYKSIKLTFKVSLEGDFYFDIDSLVGCVKPMLPTRAVDG